MTTASRAPVQANEVAVPERDHGHHHRFLSQLATIKVSAGTTGALSAVEFVAPRGFGPPLHSHRYDDELIVLEGEVSFRTGDDASLATTSGLKICGPSWTMSESTVRSFMERPRMARCVCCSLWPIQTG